GGRAGGARSEHRRGHWRRGCGEWSGSWGQTMKTWAMVAAAARRGMAAGVAAGRRLSLRPMGRITIIAGLSPIPATAEKVPPRETTATRRFFQGLERP